MSLEKWLLLELRIHRDPMKSTIDSRTQSKQTVKIDCLKEFSEQPKLNLIFTYETEMSIVALLSMRVHRRGGSFSLTVAQRWTSLV